MSLSECTNDSQQAMVTARPSTTTRAHRPRSRWVLATTTLAVASSLSASTAFQSAAPLHRRVPTDRATEHPGFHQPTRQWAVTDPDILLRETVRRRSLDLEALENAYLSSSGMQDYVFDDDDAVETTGSSVLPERKKPKRKKLPKAKNTPTVSRSSTMPGFATGVKSGREKAFQDGIRMVEQQSGKKYVDTLEAKKERRKQSSEAMYKTSASVPDSLLQFASEIHLEDRITPKEEKELGHKTQEAIRILDLKEQLEEKLSREPTDEEWCAAAGKINMEAIRQALEEGLEAKNLLVTSNLRMVQGVVNIYIRNGLGGQYNAGDMMQEGIMALIRAAEKFEPQRGFRFSTYAMYWIRAAVKRSQIFQSRVIPVPQRLYENHKRLLRVQAELKKSLGRDPTRKELGNAVGMSETQVDRCMTAMDQKCFSLDAGISNKFKPNEPEKDSLYELVQSREDDADSLKRVFVREDLIETLNRHLDPSAVDLLLLRYGLMDEKALPHGYSGPLTIAEVSTLVGLKPDKVRRMINNSLKQLQFLIGDEWDDFERELE